MSIFGPHYGGAAVAVPADNCRIGFFDYNDLATATTPISVTGGVETKLTNDGAGPQTIKTYAPVGVTDIWDEVNDDFDFSELSNGDMIDIRVDLEVTTSVINQEFSVDMNAGIGGFPYVIPLIKAEFKTAGAQQVSSFRGFYIGDDNTRLNPAEIVINSASDCDVKINGWYCKILIRG